MPLELGYRYEPSWNGYPPHMSPEDEVIWKRYKPKILSEALAIFYDVGLGGQIEVPEGTSPEMASMWLRTTQKRADVVIDTAQGWIIIELRYNATGAALGRLLIYRDLFNREKPDGRPVMLRMVTDRFDPDVKATAETIGIEYIVV